jgi:hypothetical protein
VQTNVAPAPQVARQQNPGGSPSGGVAQQYSQGETGGNPALDYQKQSLKGFSQQEKAQKRALNELLKSIKNQYSTKEKTGLSDLNKAKQEDLLKLSGLFSFANQDPDSEQRIQYEQRANQDYAKQQADFIAQLAAAQTQDISGAKQNYQKSRADIASQRNSTQQNIAQMLYQAQQDQLSRQAAAAKSSRGSTPKAGSITYIGNDRNGNPVYYNTTTGQQQTYQGITRQADPFTQFMNQQQQPQGNVQYDENGRPYIEQ